MPEITTLGRDIAGAVTPFLEQQNSVRSRVIITPPPLAAEGDRYIVPSGGTGTWAGHGGQIAEKRAGVWQFLVPAEGTSLWIDDEDLTVTFDGASWTSEGPGVPGEGGGGIPSRMNKRMAALTTTSDGQLAVAIGLARQPAPGSYVGVRLDGIHVAAIGDGTKVDAIFYFSGDGGATARAWSAIAQGDTLHFNGSVAGFQLAPTDIIEFVFDEEG